MCYLSSTVILTNAECYHNPIRRFRMPLLLLTSSPVHLHRFLRNEKEKNIIRQADRQERSNSNMLLSMLTHKFIKEMNIACTCLLVISGCGVHFPSAILDWLLTAYHSLCMWGMKWQRHNFCSLALWIYKRLELLRAGNQTINVSLSWSNYMCVLRVFSTLLVINAFFGVLVTICSLVIKR